MHDLLALDMGEVGGGEEGGKVFFFMVTE